MSGVIEIKAKADDKEAVVTYTFGETVEEMIELFGPEVVFSNARQAMKITAQSAMRRMLRSDTPEAEIQEKISAWKPGVQMERTVDPVAAFKNKFVGMDQDAKKALIAELKGQLG